MVKGSVLQALRERERREVFTPVTLAEYIRAFDSNPRAHGLDRNWYKFHGIGFLMNAQMHLLPEGAERDLAKKDVWAQQTKRDILGFTLEYLSKELVFAYKYKIEDKVGGGQELVDPLYGNRAAIDMIDPRERGGAVIDNVRRIQDFFLDPQTKDGAIVVAPSPKGPSGLVTDDGKAIDYLASFFFVMQKRGDEIVGSTIKTDFTNKEYRTIIKALTGETLPFGASLQDFVRAIAMVNPNDRREGVRSVTDVVGLMQKIKRESRGDDTAFEGRSWQEVYDGIAKGEALYNFNKQTQGIIAEFMEYVGQDGRSRLDLQKAIAATLLRISQIFLEQQSTAGINKHLISTEERGGLRVPPSALKGFVLPIRMSFGQVFTEVQKIKGCAGGGGIGPTSYVSTMGGNRTSKITLSKEDKSSWFVCPKCEERAKPPVGDTCPHCHYTKEDFVKDHPELAC